MQPMQSRRPSRRNAFTMIELLVSMAISLVVVYALVEFMKQIGDTVTDGRAMIDLATQLRGVRQRLDEDLNSLTAQTRPWSGNGYFEYREGPIWDADADGNGRVDSQGVGGALRADNDDFYDIEGQGGNTLFGDWDDILAFTAQAGAEPFVGQYNGGPQQSQLAEIIWFTGIDDRNGNNAWDANEPRFIYRRALLIRPDLGDLGNYTSYADALRFWQENDISGRVVQTGMSQWRVRCNSLDDLARRENRFAHQSGFPGRWDFDPTLPNTYILGKLPSLQDVRLGEDVMLSRVLAFDVQVFDPDAVVLRKSTDPTGAALTPDSPSFTTNSANFGSNRFEIGRGAFVDLGYASTSPLITPANTKARYYDPNSMTVPPEYEDATTTAGGLLAYSPDTKSKIGQEKIWDSWSTSYESDGIKQNSSAPNADQANDGLDNDNQNGVDDIGERDTSPPYPVPIRAIKVTMRIYDVTTRQMRQGTVVAEFMPE